MIRDILEFVKDIKDIDNYMDDNDGLTPLNLKALSKKSISRRAQDMIAQFPVLISKSVSVDEMLMISKALEREYVTFLRISMSIDDIIQDDNFDKLKFMRKNHQNVANRTDILGNMQQVFRESSNRLLEPYENLFNEKLLNEMAPAQYTNKANRILNEALMKPRVTSRRGNDNYDADANDNRTVAGVTYETQNDATLAMTNNNRNAQNAFNIQQEKNRQTNARDMKAYEARLKMNMSRDKTVGSSNSRYTNQLLDNDVRKANEMVPTMLDVEVTVVQQGVAIPIRMLMGVKTINHPIDSDEMVYNIAKSMKDKRLFFRTVQWTTGEIKFLKDFILNIDGMKKEAIANREGSPFWHIFKNRAKLDKFRRFSFSKNKLMPNGTIVITRDEADLIMNMHGIDLMNPNNAQKLLDIFFLLGFVIVDPGAELAYFLFDGQMSYQTFSYSALEKESGSGSSELKRIITLMNKVR